MRYYVKRTAVTPGELAEFEKARDYKEQIEKLGKLRAKYQGKLDHHIISFAVTYYTGAADTVPHIPERCTRRTGLNRPTPKARRGM